MPRRILIIDGHPDSRAERFVHALSKAYCEGARSAGHEVRSLMVSELEFPMLRTSEEFQAGSAPEIIHKSQEAVAWADHVVIVFPLWLGSMPALLKGFFEQLLRPGFAFAAAEHNRLPKKLLAGKSARLIVSMGMPALFYRWYFRAHSLKSLQRNILGFCGIRPVRTSIVGMVEAAGMEKRGAWLARVQELGRRGR
ncbi:MAG: flavodoxin family protein [Gammaproteobacteria bacterium]|jgi:putative NADPH-quinone reductase|nr:flavodoxin family protein [Gammaproteobacteria bacterium]